MGRPNLWSRVGYWFRPAGRPVGANDQETLDRYAGSPPTAEGGAIGGGDSVARLRLNRAGSSLERLETEYTRVVNLIESVQKHLETQGERTEQVARSLDRLAESLGHLPEASKTHLELVSAISERITSNGAAAKRIEDSLSQLPQIADAQRETMVSIGRQLDLSRQSSERTATTLDGFQQAVTLLGEATAASAKALQALRSEATVREDRVAAILQAQTQRFTWFAWAATSLALVAAAVGLMALLR